MTPRERTAWLMSAILVVAYGWYLITILAMRDGGSLTEVPYQQAAVVALFIVVALAAVSHAVVAATVPADRVKRDLEKAIVRRAGHIRGIIIGGGAAVAMTFAMANADRFWIANGLLAALVLGEMASFGLQMVEYRVNHAEVAVDRAPWTEQV